MNVLALCIIGVIFLLLLVSVFLLPKRRLKNHIEMKKTPQHLFKQETAEELSEPLPLIESHPEHKEELELPRTYGIDRLVLMVRDPYWLYAYWEVSATKVEEFNSNFGPGAWSASRPVLRVYDVTGVHFNGENANSYVDIDVNEETDNWHINVGQPDRSFCVDLGRMFSDGRFVTLLRSNVVTTPRASLSDRLDEEWMWIEGIYRSITRLHAGSSPMVVEEITQRMGAVPLGISSPGFEEK